MQRSMEEAIWLPHTATAPKRSTSVGVFLPLEAVFPEIEPSEQSLQQLLGQISRTDALFCAARLNLILSNPNYHHRLNKQSYCVNNFLLRGDIDRVNDFLADRDDPASVAVFFRAQLLELVRWICRFSTDLPNDGKSLIEREARRTFAKAALVSSELWGRSVYDGKMSAELEVAELRQTSLGAVRIAHASNSTGIDPLLAIGRGRRIFLEHMPQVRPRFTAEFASATSIPLEDYYAMTAAIGTFYLNRTPEKVCESNGKLAGIMRDSDFAAVTRDFGKLSQEYLACASLSPDELASSLWSNRVDPKNQSHWKDYKELRRRPILRSTDGRSIVVDPVFLSESATAGPLFTVLRHTPDKMKLFEQFGHAFERYSASLLREMYPRPAAPIVDFLECNVSGKDAGGDVVEICDACINEFTDLILFEMKSAWIDDQRADNSNAADYLSALREKYVESSDGDRKGVSQLAHSIERLACKDWTPIEQDFDEVKRIYPVLLTCDSALQEPLHSHFLANEFRKQFSSSITDVQTEIRVGRFSVAPLVLMTIDDLEILQRSVEKFGFVGLLRDYSQETPDRLLSLHNYLATSKYRSMLLGPGYVADSTLAALDRVGQLMGRATSE